MAKLQMNGQFIYGSMNLNLNPIKTLLPEEEVLFLARENTKLKQEIENLKAALKK